MTGSFHRRGREGPETHAEARLVGPWAAAIPVNPVMSDGPGPIGRRQRHRSFGFARPRKTRDVERSTVGLVLQGPTHEAARGGQGCRGDGAWQLGYWPAACRRPNLR
jgi:hypothetical protein